MTSFDSKSAYRRKDLNLARTLKLAASILHSARQSRVTTRLKETPETGTYDYN